MYHLKTVLQSIVVKLEVRQSSVVLFLLCCAQQLQRNEPHTVNSNKTVAMLLQPAGGLCGELTFSVFLSMVLCCVMDGRLIGVPPNA